MPAQGGPSQHPVPFLKQKGTKVTESIRLAKRSLKWRVVDIVVASVIAVASGVIFFVWNIGHDAVSPFFKALLPGLQALDGGIWLFAGVLVALVVRKPGAALFGEFVAAIVSSLLGGQYGATVLLSGAIQGLGAEVVFLIFLYSNWRVYVAILAGIGAGIAKAIFELVVWYPGVDSTFAIVYVVSSIISGAIIAGFLSWIAVRALAKTGALSRFSSGREASAEI
ncbi:MAG: ECF transporter S component [Microbacteriaceae bacterium]|nr:ECF transporter S component [Microbacteriaceae bacterium]